MSEKPVIRLNVSQETPQSREVDRTSGHQWDASIGACACGWKPAVEFHGMSHLHIEQPVKGAPHIWLQWKGTDVCADIYCRCGNQMHFDGYFMYFVKCGACGTVWEVGTHVPLYEVKDGRHAGACVKEPDGDSSDES